MLRLATKLYDWKKRSMFIQSAQMKLHFRAFDGIIKLEKAIVEGDWNPLHIFSF
jgi:hypothetical protein